MRWGLPSKLGQRIVASTLTYAIRHAKPGQLPLVREAFDEHYAAAPEEWRRDTWALAAERAGRQA
jgi:hypothetical protein